MCAKLAARGLLPGEQKRLGPGRGLEGPGHYDRELVESHDGKQLHEGRREHIARARMPNESHSYQDASYLREGWHPGGAAGRHRADHHRLGPAQGSQAERGRAVSLAHV